MPAPHFQQILFVNTRLAADFSTLLAAIFSTLFDVDIFRSPSCRFYQMIFKKANFVRRTVTFTKGLAYSVLVNPGIYLNNKTHRTPNRPMPILTAPPTQH